MFGVPEARVLAQPAEGFRPAGQVAWARFDAPAHTRRNRYTGARAVGVRFERRAQEYLLGLYPNSYIAGPWIKFVGDGRLRWCQPDGLHFDFQRGVITIIEVKYQHTPHAWFQVKQLYQPALQRMFPHDLWRFECCELVKWFDPSTPFPEEPVLANFPTMPHRGFKVHIWKP